MRGIKHVKLSDTEEISAHEKKEIIRKRRGAFKWLPVLCSNDLVHGSW